MADLEPPIVAVACVVDSSTKLAVEWNRILAEYMSPLFKRFTELYPGYQFRVGLVVYATADTRPTPVLSRRFFVPMQTFIQELRDEAAELGIGRTWDGGGDGMAALEGFVAAVEMFDDLRAAQTKHLVTSSESLANPPICHIFHVAASPPDDAHRPYWNGAASLDNVTWENLPFELKQRDIHLSIINLREFTRFSDLHSSIASGPTQQPWFSVRPPNHLSLSGFPSSQRVIKRSFEGLTAEKATEVKHTRPGLSPPKQSPTIGAAQLVQPLNLAVDTISQQLQPSMVSKVLSASHPQIQQRQLLEKMRTAEIQLQQIDEAVKKAISNGDVQAADSLKLLRDKKFATYVNFKSMIASYAQSRGRAIQDADNTGVSVSVVPSSSQIPLPDLAPLPLAIGNATSALDIQSTPQLTHSRSASSSFSPAAGANQNLAPHGAQITTGVSPHIVPQLQVVEQQGNQRTPFQGLEQATSMNASGEQQKPTPGSTIWQGVLVWNGFDSATQGRKEVQCRVSATRQSDGASYTETWPAAMMLTPSRERAVPLQELQAWIRHHKPVLCAFQPQHVQDGDSKTDDIYYRSLVQLLINKNIYALAAWPSPSGALENNLLFFPINGCGLAGAFFPMTQIPELPKPSAGLINIPPAVAAQLQKLPSEQRAQFLTKILRQKQLLQQQQQQQQQQQKNDTLTAGSSQQVNIVPHSISSNIQPPTHMTLQSGSGIGNVSYEVMQSFMQRSVEGSEAGLGPGAS